MELLMELGDILLEIYDCFGENGQNDGGQFAREVVWAYKAFGFMPKEGTYARAVLDKYLGKS